MTAISIGRVASVFALVLAIWSCEGSVGSGTSKGEAGTAGSSGNSSEAGQTNDLSGEAGTAGMTAGSESSAGAAGSAGSVTIKQLATAGPDTCALLSNGTIKCWGYNECGQVGVAAGTQIWPGTPVTVTGISDATWVSLGGPLACAVLHDGTVDCWGCNENGQLGDGTTKDSAVPVEVRGLSGAVQVIAVGGCALLEDGRVACWPVDPPLPDEAEPIPGTSLVVINGISGAIELAGFYPNICALLEDHTVACRGNNDYGQLGNGTTEPSETPVVVSGLSDVVQVNGVGTANCAVVEDGTVKCWGGFYDPDCGNGIACTRAILTPASVVGLPPAVQVATSGGTSCALLEDKTVQCWGRNAFGELGDGTTIYYSASPVVVKGLSGVRQVVTSTASCALLEDGTARCWGSNNYGQLGDGTHNDSLVPVMVTAAP